MKWVEVVEMVVEAALAVVAVVGLVAWEVLRLLDPVVTACVPTVGTACRTW